MIKVISSALLAFCLAGAALAQEATPPAEGAMNAPATVALNAFQHFEMAPVAMGAPFAGQKGNEAAKTMLQANLDERVGTVLAEWNAKAGAGGRTLRIQPEIRYVRFITGGKRFFAGGLAGGSSVMVKVRLTDADTGQLVGEPDFYQHANAIGAAWSFGATDKTMLIRIASMLRGYLQSNYEAPTAVSISQAPEVQD